MHTSIFNFTNLNLNSNSISILEDASFSISNNEKIILLGHNGSGKTTLINYIFENSNVSTGYAPQDVTKLSGNVLEYIQKTEDWWEILEILINIFNLEISHQLNFEQLSGGEKMKILIAYALSKQNKLILLDEPTNHLDLSSIKKLADYIKLDDRAYIVISHDVNFINQIAHKIVEIENGSLTLYGGNFDFYKEQKKQVLENKKARFDFSQKQVKKLEMEMKRKIIDANSRKSRMLKKIKSGNSGIPKIVAGGLIRNGEKVVSKELNKLETRKVYALSNADENKTKTRKQILFKIPQKQRRGSFINIMNAKLLIGNTLLISDLNFSIKGQESVLITGDNGSGKSILANNLSYGNHPNIVGEVIYGSRYSTFLLDQNMNMLNLELNSLDNFRNHVKEITEDEIYKYLFSLNFNLDNIKIPTKKISGGEKLKLLFAILNASSFDLLILDEPSNNLDIDSKNALIDILNSYNGTFILISHDVNFFESIKINRRYNINNKLLTENI